MVAVRNLLNRTISSRHHRSLPLLVKGEFRCYLQKKKAPYLIDENKGRYMVTSSSAEEQYFQELGPMRIGFHIELNIEGGS